MKFYQRNNYVINHKINVNFEDLLNMTPDSFNEWVEEMRDVITFSWDNYNCPPRTGKDEDKIIENWNLMETFPVHTFVHTDELTDSVGDVIINKSRMGSEVDQFFDNMFKTRINYSDKDTGYSIYDLVSNNDYLERVCKGAARHFRRDSFYSHALSTIKNSKKYSIVDVSNGSDWIDAFFQNKTMFVGYSGWIEFWIFSVRAK